MYAGGGKDGSSKGERKIFLQTTIPNTTSTSSNPRALDMTFLNLMEPIPVHGSRNLINISSFATSVRRRRWKWPPYISLERLIHGLKTWSSIWRISHGVNSARR
jgi:hypothetical protein